MIDFIKGFVSYITGAKSFFLKILFGILLIVIVIGSIFVLPFYLIYLVAKICMRKNEW